MCLQEQEMKEDKGSGAEAESQSQLVAKEDNKGNVDLSFFFSLSVRLCHYILPLTIKERGSTR